MSKYTTELRYICEQCVGLEESVDNKSVNEVIEYALPKIFDFSYPMFDESYKNVLQRKILRHYYTREISEETVGLWKLRLETKLNEIMPYYNQLYKSELLEFNPFYDVDLTRTHTIKREENENTTDTTNGVTTGSGSGTSWNLYSDTPQGSVQNLENETYLTNATKNTDTTTSNVANNVTNNGEKGVKGTEDYLESVKGKNGGASYTKLLKEYRETFINIDMMVINELKDLFFNLW